VRAAAGYRAAWRHTSERASERARGVMLDSPEIWPMIGRSEIARAATRWPSGFHVAPKVSPSFFHHFSCAGSRARPSTAAPPVVEKAPAACAVAV